jgi:eukaryotic-like serine/threonine-protein kinase
MVHVSDEAMRRLRAAGTWPVFEGTRYVALGELGRGGMGTVYLARDEALDRDVAIKVSNAIASEALEGRLRREAQVLARLEHPGIIPIHDVGRLADGRLFYVMKRVRGATLLDHVGQGSDRSERLRIFERICEAVDFAHSQGFVHRDLKPANVMIGAFGEVLVLDWGVAKLLASDAPTSSGTVPGSLFDGGTQAGTVIGTSGFMSPEQARGAVDEITVRSDVYGLGGILFTMLAGVPPAADQDAAARELDRQTGMPRRLRAVCARAMAAAPADRYPSAGALAADVARFRAGDPVDAYRESWIERAGRLGRRYQAAILLVAAYLVMRALIALFVRR